MQLSIFVIVSCCIGRQFRLVVEKEKGKRANEIEIERGQRRERERERETVSVCVYAGVILVS